MQRSYLRLDAVQTSEPEDLASPQLHLCVVDLVGALCQLLLVDLLLRGAVTCLIQELQVVSGDGCYQLSVTETNTNIVLLKGHSSLPVMVSPSHPLMLRH